MSSCMPSCLPSIKQEVWAGCTSRSKQCTCYNLLSLSLRVSSWTIRRRTAAWDKCAPFERFEEWPKLTVLVAGTGQNNVLSKAAIQRLHISDTAEVQPKAFAFWYNGEFRTFFWDVRDRRNLLQIRGFKKAAPNQSETKAIGMIKWKPKNVRAFKALRVLKEI